MRKRGFFTYSYEFTVFDQEGSLFAVPFRILPLKNEAQTHACAMAVAGLVFGAMLEPDNETLVNGAIEGLAKAIDRETVVAFVNRLRELGKANYLNSEKYLYVRLKYKGEWLRVTGEGWTKEGRRTVSIPFEMFTDTAAKTCGKSATRVDDQLLIEVATKDKPKFNLTDKIVYETA